MRTAASQTANLILAAVILLVGIGIGRATVTPMIECAEDEVIGWVAVDTRGCIHIDEIERSR